MQHIIVGSTSAHKVTAVQAACDDLDWQVQVMGMATSSGVNEQPMELAETFAGAFARASAAQAEHPGAVCIGIESGVLVADIIALDLAVIAVLTPDGRRITSTTPALEFPLQYVHDAASRGADTTVGKVVAETLGGDATDPHAVLTGGRVTRHDTLVSGLMIALRQV